jgi:uncharacterized protein (DUF58 family)
VSPNPRLFDEAFLEKLEYLKLMSRHILPGRQRGEHRARKRGSGHEFADHRQYVAGDDTRHVDWKTWLRLERLLLRLFEEEADLPIDIFVDASRSMALGEPSKFDYARRVGAALAWVGLLNHDRVGLVAFGNGVRDVMPQKRGRARVFTAFRFLEELEAAGATDLEETFRAALGGRKRRGLVVAVSDFLAPGGTDRGFDVLRYAGHDVFAVHVVSPEEARPEIEGEAVLIDAEDGTELRVEPAHLEAYASAFEEHCGRIEAYCRHHGWGYARALTDTPFEDLVLQIFQQERFLR